MSKWTDIVLDDIERERDHQAAIGYDTDHDDDHSVGELIGWSSRYRQRYYAETDTSTARKRLVQSAALLVAAIERMDREAKTDG